MYPPTHTHQLPGREVYVADEAPDVRVAHHDVAAAVVRGDLAHAHAPDLRPDGHLMVGVIQVRVLVSAQF